jgi:hypothetical protein
MTDRYRRLLSATVGALTAGTLYAKPDERFLHRPAPGAEVFAYHTDAGGTYAPAGAADRFAEAGEHGLYSLVIRLPDGTEDVSYTIRIREHGNF